MSSPASSFAVIMATCDRPALLADALRSVERQRPAPAEVRIADEGQSPVADALPELPLLELTVIPSRARQPAAARNHAARGARAEVLAFLDDDDRWLPGHLAALTEAFRDSAVELAYTDAAVIRERIEPDGRRTELERRVIARAWDPAMMKHNDYLPPSSWGVRRSLFERLGGFDESVALSEDWDFLLRAAHGTVPRRVSGVTVEVRMRDAGGLSQSHEAERRACLDRLAERHQLPPLEIRTFWEVAAIASQTP
jgi:glycosyltransferase involved in cell wall biosynthesis